MKELLAILGKYLGWKSVGKLGWFGFKAYAKYSENKYDDAIVMLKDGFEKGDDARIEKAIEIIASEFARKAK